MLGALRTICTIVGAVALYCGLMAVVWYGMRGTGRRRARLRAERRAAARAAPPARADDAAVGREPRARSWEELPSWLWQDRPWAVAVVLLGAPSVRDRTAPFVDIPNRVIDWPSLLEESRGWPADQRMLVQSAYEMVGRLEPEDGITTVS